MNGTCVNCHSPLDPQSRQTMYCSKRCRAQYSQSNNREYTRAANRASYARHREARLAARRTPEKRAQLAAAHTAYRAKRPDVIAACEQRRAPAKREFMREYNSRPEVIARSKAWRRANAERIQANTAEWKRRNPERWRELSAALMRKRRQLEGKSFRLTPQVRAEVMAAAGWKCQLCGIDTPPELLRTYAPNSPTIDHIIALSIGGPHDRSNLQLACRRCNILKRDQLPGEFVPVPHAGATLTPLQASAPLVKARHRSSKRDTASH